MLVATGAVQSILAVLQQSGFTESNHSFFDITGFFGNPGQMGGFQAVAFVAACLLLKSMGVKFFKLIVVASIILIAYSLFLADSRASFVAAATGLTVVYRHQVFGLFRNRKWLILPTVFCMAGIGILMYFYRSESVDARLLIWRVSMDMFVDMPLFGHGPGSFMKEYMLYQADYSARYPDSRLLNVADNVAYPYNEALHILVEYGIVGILAVICALAAIFRTARNIASLAPFIVILLFSLFSYPSYKLGLLVLFPITAGMSGKNIELTRRDRVILCAILSAFLGLSCSSIIKRQTDDRLLVLDCYPGKITEELIPHLRPTCENWCLIGDYYFMKSKFTEAEMYYRTASEMIPTRMLPSYSLWKLYVYQGRTEEASNIARHILRQSVKVENTYTLRVRSEIRKWLKLNNEYDNRFPPLLTSNPSAARGFVFLNFEAKK